MVPVPAGSLTGLREQNRARVVDVLRDAGGASRAELARRTGLSRTTVGSLVADLIADGLVSERDNGARGPEGGRPGVLVTLDRAAGAVVGVDFGHSHVRVAVADLAYTVLAERATELAVDEAGTDGLDTVAELLTELLEEAGMPRDRVFGAGMGLPGPIERASGLVRSGAILPSWVGVDAAAELSARLGLAVHLDNDANVGALGESTFGAGRGFEVVAYLRLDAGIGCGMIIDGRPFRGAHGFAGEMGHVLVDPDGVICRCGNRGCLETLVSGPAVCELLRRSHGELGVPELLALAHGGDSGARRAIADAGRVVGRATADLCNYLNPDVVVVGGELAGAGEALLGPMREAILRYAIPAATARLQVVGGQLGERAEVLGALALAGHEADALATHVPLTSQPNRRSIT